MIDLGKRGKSAGNKNLWISLAAMFAVSTVIGTGGYYGYRYYCESVNKGFLKGTYVNGSSVYGKTVKEVENAVLDEYADAMITITEKENTDLAGNFSFYGYEVDRDKLHKNLTDLYAAQKKDRMAILQSVFDRYESVIEEKPEETDAFAKRVKTDNLEIARYGSEDAVLYYDQEEDCVKVKPEVQGNEISDQDLQDFVRECIHKTLEEDEGLERSYEFPWELCEKPSVYRDDAELNSRMEAINTYQGAGITYEFGDETMEMNLLSLAELMDLEDGKATLSDEKIAAFVNELDAQYSTRYRERTFQSTLAGEITIDAKFNDYGYTILVDDEIEQLREDIESRKHVEREPVYLETNSWGNPYYLKRSGEDDLAGTYIEVDLTAQHVWYYKDGELYMESDCVSGDVTKDHGTHTGCFPLAYKESPSVLRGGEGDGEWEEKVQYWMPFFEGQGLHDASWRYYFGGSIYRGNGSHGCVNLPTWAAGELYEAVETGTAIIIFYE
jgi:hypothetical protein